MRGLRNKKDTLNLSRLVVQATHTEARIKLLRLLGSAEQNCRRLFLDYHGLKLLWTWMVDIPQDNKGELLKIEVRV